jgi:hypothetical protein
MKWILIIYVISKVGIDVERVAEFSDQATCNAAAEQVETAFDPPMRTTSIRYVCVLGE